jgi:hypothetical protein
MNNRFKFFAKKMFESMEKFELRLNEECRKGYRPISMSADSGANTIVVLLEKVA